NESVGDAEVFYQFSRVGHALSSQVLLLKVEAPRATPPMPTVRDAKPGTGTENYQIDASKLRRNGAFVIIPPQPKLRPGEHYDVHWHGHANGGRTVIEVPAVDDPDEPIVCNVPVDFVAANMGETDKDEAREQGLGWYLLGRGYRAYNPSLMRFHSPDNSAPEQAGINPYVYCLGNPVMWQDPTGHYAEDWGPGRDPVKRKKVPFTGWAGPLSPSTWR
ncbi:MAG: RHS repeat-associated core domain-containing protein, partial [Pseudomonadales bacterium]